jgi:hypothetical protein
MLPVRYEIFALLRCYEAYICNSGQHIDCIFNEQSLKMGPTGCPETSVTNYQSTLRNLPKDRITHVVSILYFSLRVTQSARHILPNFISLISGEEYQPKYPL